MVKNPSAHAGDIRDVGSIPGWGRSPGGGHGNPLLENSMDRGAWWATVHGVVKSQAQLKRLSTHAQTHMESPPRAWTEEARRAQGTGREQEVTVHDMWLLLPHVVVSSCSYLRGHQPAPFSCVPCCVCKGKKFES